MGGVRLSTAFKTMKANIGALQRILPPPSMTGTYSKVELINIRAFRVLSHAEVEYFIEKRCEEVILAFRACSNPRMRPKIQISLQTFFSNIQMNKYNHGFSDGELCGMYNQKIERNHGIKETNIFKLMAPLGITVSQIDPITISLLDSYGSFRGAFAHNAISHVPTARTGIPLILDSSIEIREINQLLTALIPIDITFRKLLR
jgi:hypothetical protein